MCMLICAIEILNIIIKHYLQDNLEQYPRKNCLEIHGIPECSYSSTEQAVLKLSEALEVPVTTSDIEISHKLGGRGEEPIIVKFVSHKSKAALYKCRAKLKHVKLSDLFPDASASTLVQSNGIFINESLTSWRRNLFKKTNEKGKNKMLQSVWSMDGKILLRLRRKADPLG